MKESINYELLPWVCDDIHFDFKEIDGYNKTFNYIVCSREAGKSVALWHKIYNNFKRTGDPALIIRRKIVDITPQYIDDIFTLINKFTNAGLIPDYNKGEIKQGMCDVKLNGKVFFRVIALSAPMSRLKSMVLRNVRILGFDEFICSIRNGEKYENDEAFKLFELFTTYNRESEKGIKCYFMGNPYSLWNPYFSRFNVDTKRLKKGTILTGDIWAIQCYTVKKELADYLLAHNPLYKADADYAAYAFDGTAIQDRNIRIIEKEPLHTRLDTIFRIHDKYIGVWYCKSDWTEKNMRIGDNELRYWVREMKPEEIGAKREVLTFDFGQMTNGTILINRMEKITLSAIKTAVQYREIAFANIECSYLMEEIYSSI